MASNSVTTQRFLGNRMAHTWTLHFLAKDPADIVRWGATCHIARAETSDENPVLWAYVWTRGLGKTKPLGPRQILRPKAYVLKAVLNHAIKANKPRVVRLSEAHCNLLVRLRREDPGLAHQFDHISIVQRFNSYNGARWFDERSPHNSTILDSTRLEIIEAERSIQRNKATLDMLVRYKNVKTDALEAEATRLMKKKLKRKPRKKKPKKPKNN